MLVSTTAATTATTSSAPTPKSVTAVPVRPPAITAVFAPYFFAPRCNQCCDTRRLWEGDSEFCLGERTCVGAGLDFLTSLEVVQNSDSNLAVVAGENSPTASATRASRMAVACAYLVLMFLQSSPE